MNRREFIRLAVGAGIGGLAGVRKAGAADDALLFAFAVVADPHLREDNRQCACTGLENFAKVIQKIGQIPQDQSPDLMLICGDLHVEKLEAALSGLNIPAHVTPGNHESTKHRAQLRKMFAQDFAGKDFYSFTHKNCRFISLCTAVYGDHVGHLSSEDITPPVGQCEWLETELAEKGLDHTFVFGHIPPHPEGKDVKMFLGQNDSRYLNDVVRRSEPTALFFGHQHRRREFEIGKSKCFVVRSANWNMGFREPIGFLHVKVRKSGMEADFIETGPADTARYGEYMKTYGKAKLN